MLGEAQSTLTERTYAWDFIISSDGLKGVGASSDSTSEGFTMLGRVVASGLKKPRILSV
jgi:hypothetical protein